MMMMAMVVVVVINMTASLPIGLYRGNARATGVHGLLCIPAAWPQPGPTDHGTVVDGKIQI